MANINDYFDTSEEDLKNQKEEEISLEEEEKGTIKNSKIIIEEFFDKKKLIIFGSVIVILICICLYFASQVKKNKNLKEDDKIGSISTGTGVDIKDAVNSQTQRNQQTSSQEIPQESLSNTTTNSTNSPVHIPEQYDSQLGLDYNNDNIDFNSEIPSSSEMSSDNGAVTTTTPAENRKDWRKSAIGFSSKGAATLTQETTEQQNQQPVLVQQNQQQTHAELPDTDQNKQESKSLFLKQKQDSFYSINTKNSAIGRYELKTGSLIPAVLITAINSDLPGDVIAQVRENVFDYRTGKYILIPMGTKIVGKYDSNITYGQNRVLLIWQRLVFPNGSTLVLDNFQGVDLLGNVGLKGKTNNHFWKLMRSVLLSSAINIASGSLENLDVNIEAGSRSRVNIGTGTSDMAQNIQSIGERLVEKDLNRQPTIQIKRGQKFNIFVSKDIVLSPYRKR